MAHLAASLTAMASQSQPDCGMQCQESQPESRASFLGVPCLASSQFAVHCSLTLGLPYTSGRIEGAWSMWGSGSECSHGSCLRSWASSFLAALAPAVTRCKARPPLCDMLHRSVDGWCRRVPHHSPAYRSAGRHLREARKSCSQRNAGVWLAVHLLRGRRRHDRSVCGL